MNSLSDYSMNLPEKDYHAYPAWSYSQIARYAREGFGAVQTIHDPVPQNPAMTFGSLVDCMLTKGMDAAESEYAVMDDVPTGQEKAVWDYILDNIGCQNPDSEDIMRGVNATGYHQSGKAKWGVDACMSHLEPYRNYYDSMRSGKEIVSSADWLDAKLTVDALKTNELTSTIFRTTDENNGDMEYIYQSQFKAMMDVDVVTEVEMKVMPDLIILNHSDKTIRLVDLKTSGVPSREFAPHWVKMRYDIQAQLYSDVVMKVLHNDPELGVYTVLPYWFVDISRTDKIPLVFEYDQTDFNQQEGLSYAINDRVYTYKSWRKLLKEIMDYEDSGAIVPSYLSTNSVNNLLKAINDTK